MRILVTGFNPFRGVRINPSELVVKALAQRTLQFSKRYPALEIITAILPTEYIAATRLLRSLMRTTRPDGVICLGVASRRERISLERVALNWDDDPTPDNAGRIRRGRRIAPGGPDVYWSTLPLDPMREALRKHGIKSYVSNHAGTFVCNHAFYVARKEAARRPRPIPCGFIHLPGHLPGQLKSRQRSHTGAAVRRFVEAIECCLKVLGRETARKKKPG